jgi:hypothetical protein
MADIKLFKVVLRVNGAAEWILGAVAKSVGEKLKGE